jgi:hypothetical protein
MPKENDLEGHQDMGGKHGGQAGMPKPKERSSAGAMISDCVAISRQPVCQRSGYWIPSRGGSPPISMKLHGHASITALLLHAGLIDNVCYVLNIWWAGPRLSFGLTSRVTVRRQMI